MSEQRLGPAPVTMRRAVAIVARVVDAATSAPLAGALVQIVSGPREFEARRAVLARDPARAGRLDRRACNERGEAIFADLPPGDYALEARAPHLGTRYAELAAATARVAAHKAKEPAPVADVRLALEPTLIAGKVTAGSRTAVAGAELRLRSGEAATRAAEDGSYTLGPVPAGQLELDVAAAGFVGQTVAVAARAGKTTDRPVKLVAATTSGATERKSRDGASEGA